MLKRTLNLKMQTRWLLSSFILAISIFLPSIAFSQSMECSYVGPTKRLAECDGKDVFIFPEEKARKLLADVKKIPSLKKEIRLKQRRIDILNEKLSLKDEYIGFLKQENSQIKDTNKQLLSSGFPKQEKFWERGWVQFGIGFVAASTLYIGWQATYDRIN